METQQQSLFDLTPDPSLEQAWRERPVAPAPLSPSPPAQPKAPYRYTPAVTLPYFFSVGEWVKSAWGVGVIYKLNSYAWVKYPNGDDRPHLLEGLRKTQQPPDGITCLYSPRIGIVQTRESRYTVLGFAVRDSALAFLQYLKDHQLSRVHSLMLQPQHLPYPHEVWVWGLDKQLFRKLRKRPAPHPPLTYPYEVRARQLADAD